MNHLPWGQPGDNIGDAEPVIVPDQGNIIFNMLVLSEKPKKYPKQHAICSIQQHRGAMGPRAVVGYHRYAHTREFSQWRLRACVFVPSTAAHQGNAGGDVKNTSIKGVLNRLICNIYL
jgi:hypothetical protein